MPTEDMSAGGWSLAVLLLAFKEIDSSGKKMKCT